jgi:hypothetical protein
MYAYVFKERLGMRNKTAPRNCTMIFSQSYNSPGCLACYQVYGAK